MYFANPHRNPRYGEAGTAQFVGDSTQPDSFSTGEDGISSISRLYGTRSAGQLVDADIAKGNRCHTRLQTGFHTTLAAADFPLVRWKHN
ncbi:MAG: hypothetical protein FIA89_03970 [Geobacter sp.]|nr:hypothetical protein [Geobacter sp.]